MTEEDSACCMQSLLLRRLDQEIRAMPITNDCASFEIA